MTAFNSRLSVYVIFDPFGKHRSQRMTFLKDFFFFLLIKNNNKNTFGGDLDVNVMILSILGFSTSLILS